MRDACAYTDRQRLTMVTTRGSFWLSDRAVCVGVLRGAPACPVQPARNAEAQQYLELPSTFCTFLVYSIERHNDCISHLLEALSLVFIPFDFPEDVTTNNIQLGNLQGLRPNLSTGYGPTSTLNTIAPYNADVQHTEKPLSQQLTHSRAHQAAISHGDHAGAQGYDDKARLQQL